MFPLDAILAVALLTTPPELADFSDPIFTPELYAQVRPTLQSLAVQWEVLDPREVRYVLIRLEDFPSDLKLLRRRYHELCDAPPLQDCKRFPDRSTISDLLAFNRSYRQHLDSRQAIELVNWWGLQEEVEEVDRLYQVWDTLRDARCDYYYVTVRRQALKRLREMVGPEAYCTNTLPPHVPYWRFQKAD
jgi:hypothetical protein